jgi:hypothetical protein
MIIISFILKFIWCTNNTHFSLRFVSFNVETFHMIEQCDQSIASWSNDGRSFIIRNVDSFSNVSIPSVYRHSLLIGFYPLMEDISKHRLLTRNTIFLSFVFMTSSLSFPYISNIPNSHLSFDSLIFILFESYVKTIGITYVLLTNTFVKANQNCYIKLHELQSHKNHHHQR